MKPSLIATMVAAGICLAAAPAIADAPNTLGQQGRLFDRDGEPIEGEVSVVYSLYDTATGGTALWTEPQTLTVEDGYFVTTLGRTTPIEMAAFADGNMFLTVRIEDDDEMMPRAQLVSVPFALVARDAVGDIHPSSVSIGDQLVIDEEGQWVGDIIGLQGEVGPEGPQGDVGPAGPAGSAGADGATGPAGLAGADGATGPAGRAGADGAMGPAGPAGADGAMGPAGPVGADGAMGPAGPVGADGAMGPQGPVGLAGADGATGPAGPVGADGVMGPQGPAGLAGADGTDGAMGPQGPAGLAGADGADGAMGPAGPAGADGATGPQGPAGLAGADGTDGAMGQAGSAGADGATGPMGPAGVNGLDGINGLDGATGPMGSQGPAGIDGLDGATGPMGPQGPAGVNGLDGIDGVNGLDGLDGESVALASLPIGDQDCPYGGLIASVGATAYSVCNGADGVDGATGPMGPQGPAGLNGLDGINGLDGATGPMGPQGVAGLNGVDGSNGLDGSAGLDGATGPMGPQGTAGLDGLDGATGPMGPQGPAGLDGLDGATGPMGPQGPAGLLSSGSQFGNTPYWNGGFWVTNSNNLFNNGGSIGIGTSSPGAKLDVVGNVRIADGTQGDRKVLMSDGNGNASWNKIVSGYVLIGDVASGISTAVGGDISFASKSNSGSSSTITVNFEDQGNTNFVPMVSLISLGTADDDNDVETPVILNVTSTSFDVFLNETNGTTQDLRINVVLTPF